MNVATNRLCVLVVAALAVSTLWSCAATMETKMQTLVAGQRVDPPAKGRNKVYIDFGDHTGEGADFENHVYESICGKVVERGYDLVNHDEADYVLWATLRFYDRVGTEEGNKALAGLGAVAGGVAVGTVTAEVTGNATAGWLAGLAGGAGTGMAIEYFTRKDHWAMAIDLQLGRRLDEAAKRTIRVEDQRRIQSASIAGLQSGIVGSVEGGGSGQQTTASTEVTETTVFLELEQRVIAQATSSGKSKEDVANALIERISNGLASQLPRYQRM
jgi:hypothetical protein